MKKKRKNNFFFNAGWFMASLAAGIAIALILLMILFLTDNASGHQFFGAVFLATTIGLPIGMYLLRVIFYKTVKRDFFAMAASVLGIVGLLIVSRYFKLDGLLMFFSPLMSILVYQMIEPKNNRKSRFGY